MSAGGRRPPRSVWRRPVPLLGVGAVVGLAVVLGPSVAVRTSVGGHVHHDVRTVEPAPVAIVLGAGLDGAGRPSPFLAERIGVAVELYRAGRVRALLMSGDHSRTDHDEVAAMAAEAQRLGVPASAVVQDHAGFDTYSSCYRARSVWGIDRAVVVTQPFHVARAVWICRQLGVDAQGAVTAEDDVPATDWGRVREVPATGKSVLDVWRGRTPIFPGPREHTLDPVTASG